MIRHLIIPFVNIHFINNRELIPTEPVDRKLSKIETLRLATSYIEHLASQLTRGNNVIKIITYKHLYQNISILDYLEYFKPYKILISDPQINSACVVRQEQYTTRPSVYSSKWNTRRSLNGYSESSSITNVETPRRTICTFCLADIRKTNSLPDFDSRKK